MLWSVCITSRNLSAAYWNPFCDCPARALATNPKILLLDEPAAGMNPHETEDLAQTIRFIRDHFDMTILLIEHDMSFVAQLCDELTVLSFGTVLSQGDTKAVLQDPEVINAYIGG